MQPNGEEKGIHINEGFIRWGILGKWSFKGALIAVFLFVITTIYGGIVSAFNTIKNTSEIDRMRVDPLLEDNKTRALAKATRAYKMYPVQTSQVFSNITYSAAIDNRFDSAFQDHSSPITTAVFSKDSRKILTVAKNGIVKLWSPDGRILANIDTHLSGTSTAMLSSNGQYVVAGSTNHTGVLLDVFKNKKFPLVGHKAPISSVSISPGTNLIITASRDGTVKLWDQKGRLRNTIKCTDGIVSFAVFSPSGNRIITTLDSGKQVKMWDIDGELITNFETQDNQTYHSMISPNGNRILVSNDDGIAKLWDSNQMMLQKIKLKSRITGATFSPDQQKIFVKFIDGNIGLWETGKNDFNDLHISGTVADAAHSNFTNDGKLLFTSSKDGRARIRNLEDGTTINIKLDENIIEAALSPDGKTLLTGNQKGIAKIRQLGVPIFVELKRHMRDINVAFFIGNERVFTASEDGTAIISNADGEFLKSVKDNLALKYATFSTNGQHILMISSGGAVSIWDTQHQHQNPRHLIESDVHSEQVPFYSASFAPNSQLILTINEYRKIQLWNIDGTQLPIPFAKEETVSIAKFSQDNQKIYILNRNGVIKAWNLNGDSLFESVLKDNELKFDNAVFTPDIKLILIPKGGIAKLFDISSNLRAVLNNNSESSISSMAFSDNGQKIITCTVNGTVSIWNLSGKLLLEFNPHGRKPNSVQFSPNSDFILTSADDGNAKLWDLSGKLMANLPHPEPVPLASFSPDGRRILTTSTTTAKIWYTPVATFEWLESSKQFPFLMQPD